VHGQPQGPAFDIVLLLHVACVVVGMATLVASAATATRMRKLLPAAAPLPEAVARYFRPGVNWAGRAIYGIPVLGFVLLAMSKGSYALGDGWVMSGLVAFVVVVLLAEGALWPAERRLQASLVPYGDGGTAAEHSVLRDVKVMATSSSLALALLVAGTVVMVAQP
jgi:uncharacterized membrane protein